MNLNSTNKKIKNKNNIKNNENINKKILNKFDLNEKANKNRIYIINKTETEIHENKDNDRFDKIKELLNQDFDSESSDNKLLFKEKKRLDIKNLSESFDAPRKKSIGSNKKYKKIKSDNKDKIKNKKIKEKIINKVENIEESPGQRKPGKKVQFSNNNNLYDRKYNIFEKELGIDDLGQNINKIETKKKKKKRDLSSSVDIALNKNEKKTNRIFHHSRKKSNEECVGKINIKGINDYFEYKSINYIKDEDINPDVQNIEITQDSDNEKKQKKLKKGKKGLSPEIKEEKKKIKLIKIYNRALHLLRKAIRSYKKRNKTFDPDYELIRTFQKWIAFVSKSNIYDYKNELKDENKRDIQEKKINALKEVFNIINIHNKKIKGRLSEDEENYNYIKWCYNIWLKNSIDIKENDNNNHIENKNSENIYYMKNKNIMNNNEIIEININEKDIKEKKESKKDDINIDKKKKKHIESESLLEIDLEEKKTKKHKVKKRKINRNNNSINSNNSSFKKEEKDFDKSIEKLKESLNKFHIENFDKQNIKENEEIIIKNIPKEEKLQQGQLNIDINKIYFEKSKINESKRDEIKNNIINEEEKDNKDNKENINNTNILKTEESIFQKIRREFPLNNNDYCVNTDYIREKEEEDKKKIIKEEENPSVPPKIQPPPQVLALMKKQGKLNLPLPKQNNNLRLSYREFGKGNLEIVEPGELVSSERLKMVKINLKRNLTYSTTFIEEKNSTNNNNTNKLIKSSYFKNDAFNLNYDNKRNIKEIYKKLYPIFEKKDEGLFNKKKYFNIWGSKTDKRKKFNISLNIGPEVKKAKNTPIIFLTKSIQEENQEENFIDGNDNGINKKKNNFEKDDINNIYKIESTIQQNNDNNIIIENNVEAKKNDEKYIKEINNQPYSVENSNNNHNENEINIKENNINNIEEYSNKSLKNINKEEKEDTEEEEEEEEEDEENEKEEKANNNKEKDIKNLNILNIQKDEKGADINNIDEAIRMEIKEKDNSNKKSDYHTFTGNTKIKPIYNEEKDIMKVNINSKDKEKEENIKYIYQKLKTLNKSNNCTFNFFKNNHLNNNLKNDLMKKEYNSFLDEQNKKIKAFQLYLFYTYFNENYEYYLLRNNFYKLKKNNNIFKYPSNKNHIKSYGEHCISCSCENDNILLGQTTCLNCDCNEIKTIIKNILIKYKYSKDLNPIRYYFYLWFKNILNK